MLAPDHRHVLLDLLRPPAGYELDGAVGTTFTLDLEAALVAPLAFAAFRIADTRDPIAVMEAVRSAADRLDIFCQGGQIAAPAAASALVAFAEPMIHDVRRPRPGRLFHPKVWFLRFLADDEAPAVRLLCLTRNLTKDTSWDVALRLDGVEERAPKAANRPVSDLIRALPTMAVHELPAHRKRRIEGLAESARRARWEAPEGFKSDVNFWAFGLGGSQPTPQFDGYRHLVVAPFLNAKGLATVAPNARSSVTVVSTTEDLDALGSDRPAHVEDIRVVSASADLADPDDQELVARDDRSRLSGLHAKLYVVERNRSAHVFIGSANATDAAFGGNVEFLVELVGGATRFGVDRFLADEGGLGSLIETYAPGESAEPDATDEALWRLENALRDAAAVPLTATVVPGEGTYSERIEGAPLRLPADMVGRIELLTRPGRGATVDHDQPVSAVLGPVDLDEITPFVVLRLATTLPGGGSVTRSSVLRAHLVDEPDGRLDEILARQVDTPEKFLRFLLLLLGFADTGTLGEGVDGDGSGVFRSFARGNNGLFELLVRAATERPAVFDDLQRIVPKLQKTERGRAALPEGFDELWEIIDAARPDLERLRRAGDR